jgi:tetrahydromethanopterin S-methyltransferase subunit G
MATATKKIIQLSDELIGIVNDYTAKNNLSSFSEAIRLMISNINAPVPEASPSDTDEFLALEERVQEIEKNYKYFQADETQSTIGNMNVKLNDSVKKLEEMEKKVNILTSVSKMFKGHLENRDIHLQD